MKKLLSVLLAILCVMNLTVVSFAAEEVSYFDEETGTLYVMTENWVEDLGNEEIDESFFDFCGKVKTVYVGEECGTFIYESLLYWFSNLEKIVVDEDCTELFVYDNALYSNRNYDGKEVCELVVYPAKCPDKDIVLHPDATGLQAYAFDVTIPENGVVVVPGETEYNLYIVEEGQFEKIKGDSECIYNMMHIKFTNIYVNDTQESIDETYLGVYSKAVPVEYFTMYYQYHMENFDSFWEEKTAEITSKIEKPENPDDPVANKEYDELVRSSWLDYTTTFDYEEYTEELHAQMGESAETYEFDKMLHDRYYDLYVFCRDRGNPVKPLSTLTSGTCGEGAEWVIDRENGVLSITGNGAISDNYSGFDVFKGIVTTVEIGSGITAIGENVFAGFTALTETKFDGTQSQWDAVTVADGNEDLTKNVTVIPETPDTPDVPDTPVTPDTPDEPAEPTIGEKIVDFLEKIGDFFVSIYEWFVNLFKF